MRKWLPLAMASLRVLAILPLVGAAVQAAPPAIVQETALLARAYAIDLRCRVLSSADSDDLARHLLDSQALLARQSSLQEAQAAVAEGNAAAVGSLCTLDDKSLVVSALAQVRGVETAAANQAGPVWPPYNAREPMELTRKDQRPAETHVAVTTPALKIKPALKIEPEPKIEPEHQIESAPKIKQALKIEPEPKIEPEHQIEPAPKIKQAKAKSKVQEKKKIVARVPQSSNEKAAPPQRKPRKSEGLKQYGGLVESYYVALKCRSITYEDAMRLYSRILKSHRTAVAAYPQFEVRAILREAKAKADMADCE